MKKSVLTTTTSSELRLEMSFKIIATFLLALLLAGSVLAECGGGLLSAFPQKTTLAPNTQIVLEASGHLQSVIEDLDGKAPAFLVAKGHRVALELVETCHGMFGIKQAVLQPKELLKEGLVYTLSIPNSTYSDQLTRYQGKEKSHISWTVSQSVDHKTPQWISTPELDFLALDWFGCGPSVFAIFDLEIEEESEFMVRTELLNLTSESTSTFSLRLSRRGQLEVGHGMCGGPFSFTEDTDYQIRFALVDASGNSSFWTTWQDLANPYDVESQGHPMWATPEL